MATLKKTQNCFQDLLSLNSGQKYCRMLLSTFVKLPFVITIFVLSIFEWPFYTGFTVHNFQMIVYNLKKKSNVRNACITLNTVNSKKIAKILFLRIELRHISDIEFRDYDMIYLHQ